MNTTIIVRQTVKRITDEILGAKGSNNGWSLILANSSVEKKVSSDSFAEVASRKLYSYEKIQHTHSFYRENYLQCYIECNFEGKS